MRIIGAADEFWRLRLTRVDTTDGVDFEWHEDILYRAPRVGPLEEVECYRIEAVRLDDYEAVVCIAAFDEREEAETFLEGVADDLADMTKTQFEEAYLTPDATAPAPETS